MDLTDSLVKEGVIIVHQVHEGKHHYVVDNVVNYKTRNAENPFVRGDRVTQLNDVDLQDLQPEIFAKRLAEGRPWLKVHKPVSVGEKHKQPPDADETLHCTSKEVTQRLRFIMEMTREEDQEGGRKDGGREENGEERDLLIVTMEKTSISVVKGRGCESGNLCAQCYGTGCLVNSVVMVSESSTVKIVPRGSYRQDVPVTASIEHKESHLFIRSMCSGLYVSPNPERITIYHYKSNFMDSTFRGMPVVLNFTETNHFVRCCKDGERVSLQVQSYEKQRLKQISKSDEEALSFVFYMKSDGSRLMKFESALHSGWFIQVATVNHGLEVTVNPLMGQKDEQSFFFVIKK